MRRIPGARYIRLETNQGVTPARNEGIRASKGKYVAFLDDDDLWLPHRIKEHVSVLEACPEIGWVYGQYVVPGEGRHVVVPLEDHCKSFRSLFQALLMRNLLQLNVVLVRSETFKIVGLFDENLRAEEDYDCFSAFLLRFL